MSFSALTLCVSLLFITLSSASHLNSAHLVVQPSDESLPFPTPCVPQPVTISFATTSTAHCLPGKEGRIIDLTFNDACTFFTYKVKLCRRVKVANFASNVRRCLRKSIERCSNDVFGKCGNVIRRDCPRGKLLELSAIA